MQVAGCRLAEPPVRQARPERTAAPIVQQPAQQRSGRITGLVSVFSGTTAFLSQHLYGLLHLWPAAPQRQLEDTPAPQLLQETAERALEVVEEQKQKEDGVGKEPLLNITRFLKPVGIMELRYVRMLSSLCAHTYCMEKLTDRALFRRHRLKLITTSLACEKSVADVPVSALQVITEGDSMAASLATIEETQRDLLDSTANEVSAMQVIKKLDQVEVKEKRQSPADRVTEALAGAAAAAAAAAAPLATGVSSLTSAASSAPPIQAVASQLQSAASVGTSSAVATLATVTAALNSVWDRKAITKKQAASSTWWYVADDEAAHTRYFVIQGSENLDHWRVNLAFDPVIFEDASLDVKVHRGIYEAARILYDIFLPMVEEHLASSPFAKLVFTGHSLGGSLGMLLMLMYQHRGVAPPASLGPVYAFGAPAIFCETNVPARPSSYQGASSSGRGAEEGLLERLGLNSGAIRNIMMHRDIVPRAFACDYALVADILSRVSESFRDHECLHDSGHKVMYYFLGRLLVLQPDAAQSFVRGERDHPMLPPGPNLYALRQPSLFSSWGMQTGMGSSVTNAATRLGKQAISRLEGHLSNIQPASALVSLASSYGGPEAQSRQSTSAPASEATDDKQGREAGSVREAMDAVMDTPHPLDILGEPGSYGFDGAISRYHNPDNYTKALGGVLRSRERPWRPALAGEVPSIGSTPSGGGGRPDFAVLRDVCGRERVPLRSGRGPRRKLRQVSVSFASGSSAA